MPASPRNDEGAFSKTPGNAPWQISASDSNQVSGLRNTLRVLRKHRILILAIIFASLAVAIAISKFMKPVYEAELLIEVLPEGSDTGNDLISGAVSSLMGGDQLKPEVLTQVDILRDKAVTLDVVNTLNLQDRPPFKYVPGRFFKNKRLIAEQGMPLDKAAATRARILGMFQQRLDVQPIPNTRLIRVKVSNPNADEATEIANTLVNSLIKNHLRVRYSSTLHYSDWMAAQLNNLKQKVDESEEKLGQFEQETGLFAVSTSGGAAGSSAGGGSTAGGGGGGAVTAHSPVLDKFAALNSELTAAEAARIAKEAVYRLTQSQNPDVVIGLGTSSLGNAAGITQGPQGDSLNLLQSLRTQEAALKVQAADAATKYGAKNPHIAELQNQISQLDKQMAEEINRISQRAKNDFELAKVNEDEIRKQFNKEEIEAVKVNSNALKAQVLAEEAASNQLLYEELYARLQEASVSVGMKGANINIIDPALPPPGPKWPNMPINLALGLIFGGFLSVATAFTVENLDDNITTAAEVEQLTQIPVFGTIPLFSFQSSWKSSYGKAASARKAEPSQATDPSVPRTAWMLHQPKSVIAESYRSLRTSIMLSRPSGSVKSLMITSAGIGDGKSTTTLNLALAFAQSGQRILVIDADMRRPRLHRLMQTGLAPGLSNVLATGTDVASAIRRNTLTQNLDFMSAGSLPPTPAELLTSGRFAELLNSQRESYDLILVDTPPLLHVADAVVVGNLVDTILMIVRSGVTRRQMMLRAIETTRRQCLAFMALVVNGVDTMSADYYYTYGYYGTGEYYGDADENS
jgi:succinoglycan biosynthesis transport protein ExoP